MLKRLLKQRSVWPRCFSSFGLNAFTLRTHNCGELRSEHNGENVKLYGWVQFRRGSGRFIVLRDAYGLVQIILDDSWKGIGKSVAFESVVRVEGTVRLRPEQDRNPKMLTGDIEIEPSSFEVINPCRTDIPFENKSYNVVQDELIRAKYRYLDLRRPEMLETLRLRSNVVSRMRRFLTDEAGFVDVETPTLFRKTPGGAAEFLVPTRIPHEFYCLPQSPQQFKQLLMVAGVDRYFQIARCYRDEGGRKDRQPEFTQVDLELSFTNSAGVMELVEQMLIHSWPQSLPPIRGPFPLLRYDEALRFYGSDKPDLRFDWKLHNVTSSFDTVAEGPFRNRGEEFYVSCFVAPCSVPKRRLIGKWKDLLEVYHPTYSQHFSVCSLDERELSGSIAKYLNDTVKEELVQRLNLKPGCTVVISWGERERALHTCGLLRTKLADEIEERGVEVRQKNAFQFLWIVDFPLFERNGQLLESVHHPFTAPIPEHEAFVTGSNPEKALGQHYDLVLNGVELGGGSIRIHDSKLQKHVLENVLKEDPSSMTHLLEALEFGAPPHGGFALGFDRYISLLAGKPNIREVIAFPKTMDGRDLMSKAPAPVASEILHRYHIATVGPKN